MVGASDAESTAGAAYEYLGGPGGLEEDESADFLPVGSATGLNFGNNAASLGDVDGDGYEDVAVAESYLERSPKVSIFHGSSIGLTDTAAVTLSSSTPNTYFLRGRR